MNKQNKKIKRTLRIIGISLLTIGIIFSAIGFINFFVSFSSMEPPKLFWCAFLGLPLVGVGLGTTLQSYRGEIAKFVAEESAPAAQTFLRGVTPAVSDLAKEIASSNPIVCECGTQNNKGDKFCKACGKTLIATCPHCNVHLAPDSKFCTNCGKEI